MPTVKGQSLRKGACGKGVYLDEDAAIHGIAQINRRLKSRNEATVNLRPYLCRRCDLWHLTRRGALAYWARRRDL